MKGIQMKLVKASELMSKKKKKKKEIKKAN